MSDWHLKVTVIPLVHNLYILKETVKVISHGLHRVRNVVQARVTCMFWLLPCRCQSRCCCLPHFTVHSVCCILILCAVGHVMAQAVSWWPFTWGQLRLNDRPVPVGFVADIVVLGQVFISD